MRQMQMTAIATNGHLSAISAAAALGGLRVPRTSDLTTWPIVVKMLVKTHRA
jgi:hypothetical protein